jgi:hypothetical protein
MRKYCKTISLGNLHFILGGSAQNNEGVQLKLKTEKMTELKRVIRQVRWR